MGGPRSGALGISEDGLVYGNSQTASNPTFRLFTWSYESGLTDISRIGGRTVYPAEQPLSPDGNYLVGKFEGRGKLNGQDGSRFRLSAEAG